MVIGENIAVGYIIRGLDLYCDIMQLEQGNSILYNEMNFFLDHIRWTWTIDVPTQGKSNINDLTVDPHVFDFKSDKMS